MPTQQEPGFVPSDSRKQRLQMFVLTCVAVLVAVSMMHDIMFASGFEIVQTTPRDSRFVNLVFEHEYQWFRGNPESPLLWDLPMFYPAQTNTLARLDSLLSVFPLYAVFRFSGLGPESAHQTWLISITVINVLVALLFFRKVVRAPPVAATVGGLLFCVAAPRLALFDHQQFHPLFWYLLFATGIVQTVRAVVDKSAMHFTLWPSVAAIALAMQLWGAFYLAFFIAFTLIVGAGVGLVLPGTRAIMWRTLRYTWPSCLLAGFLFALLVAPFSIMYGGAMQESGAHEYGFVLRSLPHLRDWIYMDSGSYVWGWRADWTLFQTTRYTEVHPMGVGLVTVVVALIGLWLRRRDAVARWLFLSILAVVLIMTPIAGHSLWRFVYEYVPSAGALRAVYRIIHIVILPIALAVAAAIARLEHRGHVLLALLVGTLCVGEQRQLTCGYDRREVGDEVEAIMDCISPTTEAFFVSTSKGEFPDAQGRTRVSAVWAALRTGCPTINGHASKRPDGYRQLHVFTLARNEKEVAKAEHLLAAWCKLNNLDLSNITWIHDGQVRPFSNKL